jgi:predicted Zn-dependent protease
MQMGQEYAAEINRQVPLVNDAAVNSYVNQLGRNIAAHGGRQIPYNFYMVNAPQVNAFAVPGGHIYLNRGLVERTRNESELAGVLAHEVAHVEHRHGIDQMERMQGANLALTAATCCWAGRRRAWRRRPSAWAASSTSRGTAGRRRTRRTQRRWTCWCGRHQTRTGCRRSSTCCCRSSSVSRVPWSSGSRRTR